MASRLRCSAAPRWVPCPASVKLCEQYPDTDGDTQPAMEGTAAHWVASSALERWISYTDSGLPLVSDYIGEQAPNGIIITEEMVEAVDVYIKDVLKVLQARGSMASTYIERHVSIHNVHPENEGTFDGCVFTHDVDDDSITLWDFKYGWGIIEPHGNWQLVDYMIGLLAEWEARNIPLPKVVELRVVQPRPHHPLGKVRVWRATLEEIYSYFQALRAAAHEAMGDNPAYNPGPQCNNCSGRAHCTALHRATYSIMEFVDTQGPDELSGEALGARVHQLTKYAKLIDALKTGVEQRALSKITSNEVVPGWSAVQGTGRVKWNDDATEKVLILGELMGVKVSKPVQLITPTQAIKAGIDKAVISSYSYTPSTGLKLAPMDSNKIKQSFNNTTE